MEKKIINLVLTMEDVNIIIAGLGELKAGVVFNLLNNLQSQISTQLRQQPASNEQEVPKQESPQ